MSSTPNKLEKALGIDPSIHQVWKKFSKFITNAYGKDLYGEWQFHEFTDAKGKKNKWKFRSFDENKLAERLVGYEVMKRVRRYVEKYIPEIKIISCDDETYSGSIILLIPHIKHGITILYIPQCTNIQNQFFLYPEHYKSLLKGLKEMNYVYKDANL